jgi:4-diphosphocytidyl-2-C-methyl-D-erythritol kinase
MSAARTVRVIGRAKINLFLRVGGRRADGFHEIETVMQTIDLCDEMVMMPADATKVEFVRAPGYDGPLPRQPDLVEEALALAGVTASVKVTKRIPLGAGLGGGSADAAAALVGAARLAGEDWDRPKLAGLGARLGSDVPFALIGGTAVATGRGEVVTPVESPQLWWVLLFGKRPLSTAEVYRRFDEKGKLNTGSEGGPGGGSARIVEALQRGDPYHVGKRVDNDLFLAALSIEPSLPEVVGLMQEAGALGVVMTGSGSTVIGLCADQAHAEMVAGRLGPGAVVAPSTAAGAEAL